MLQNVLHVKSVKAGAVAMSSGNVPKCRCAGMNSQGVLLLLTPELSVCLSAVQKRKYKMYRAIILSAVLYGCETRSLMLRV